MVDKKYSIILEKVGNQPLMTTKILCGVLGLGLAAAKGMVDKAPVTIASGIDEAKALDLKKQLEAIGNTVSVPGLKVEEESSAPAKKTASNKSSATDDAFDAIFGAGSAQKATPPVKSKATMKTEAKKTTSKTSAKAETKTTTSKTSTKSETKTTTKKKTAAASDDFDALFGGTTPKAETKSTTKKSTPKVVDKQVVIGEYFAELAQLRQGIKETGTYSGDGDMKPEIALAMYGDMDALFSCFKKQIITSSMRIDRSELEKQYKKLDKKIEKMKKASRLEKMIRCFSDDDQKVPCISYELALRCLRNNRPGSYLNYLYTAAAGGDPRAITYEQRYHSTNTNDANPFSWTFDIKFNGEFNFYQMFHYAVRGIGFDYSPYYPDSSIAIPASTFDEVNVNVDKQRAKSLAELLQTLSYFALPENIGTTEYKEHFGDFLPSELQIKIARHWFFIEDDRLVMSEETKKLRDEMKEKITNAVCNTPADAADTAKKTTSAVKTATAETTSESESKTAPQIISLDLGDGDSYEGEMKDGKYHGMGTYRWGNGNVYTGEYVNDVRQGKGKFAFASGSSYEGEWKNGKYHGKGKWTNADGSYYTGVWENDDIIDSTKIEYPAPAYASESVKPAAGAKIERMEYDNGVYEGEMANGSRHGKGKYTWNNGSEYEGDWVKGKKCGFGIYKSYSKNEKDGSTYLSYIYEGEWKDGKHHGRGVAKGYKAFPLFGHVYMNWSYDGPWVDDKKHGRGVYRDWDGNAMHDMWKVFEGEWVDDTRQGIFTMKYEPSGTGKTYINYYVDGNAEVWGAPYDPSIKTLEDARRAKEKESAKERREYDEKKSREAAQSRTASAPTTTPRSDSLENFEYVEDLIEKLKNPTLFNNPADRSIVKSNYHFGPFIDRIEDEFKGSDYAAATELFANILGLDSNGLMEELCEKLGYIGGHDFGTYIDTCLKYAHWYINADMMIPFANLCYYCGNYVEDNFMSHYTSAHIRHSVTSDCDILYFERYANGNPFEPLSEEDDFLGHEAECGDELDELLNSGYRMGSDCRLYLPENAESYELTAIDEEYQMEQILSNVYKIGEWNEYTEDAHKWEHGSFAMDTYYAWLENEDAHLFLLGRNGATKTTGFEKGNYSKRRVALIPMRNYIHDAMLANEQVRRNVPPSQRAQFELQLNNIIEEARMYLKSGHIVWAMDSFRDAFDYGYEPEKLAEICYDAVSDVLGENEDHWEFDDPYVEIMKIAAICDPESYAYYFSNISKLFGAYSHKYIYEVLTGEEYPG